MPERYRASYSTSASLYYSLYCSFQMCFSSFIPSRFQPNIPPYYESKNCPNIITAIPIYAAAMAEASQWYNPANIQKPLRNKNIVFIKCSKIPPLPAYILPPSVYPAHDRFILRKLIITPPFILNNLL